MNTFQNINCPCSSIELNLLINPKTFFGRLRVILRSWDLQIKNVILQEFVLVACVPLIHLSGKALCSWIVSQWTTDKQKQSGYKKAKLQTIWSEGHVVNKSHLHNLKPIKLVYLQAGVKSTPLSIGGHNLRHLDKK